MTDDDLDVIGQNLLLQQSDAGNRDRFNSNCPNTAFILKPQSAGCKATNTIRPPGIPDRSSRSSPKGSPIDRVDRALGDPRSIESIER